MDSVKDIELEEQDWINNTYQGNQSRELSLKSLSVGAILGILLISSNTYMGLKTGFTEGGSVIAAILAFAIIKAFRSSFTILENNIAQTTASAAASIGIMVSAIPALIMLGYSFSGFELFLWIFLVSMLGIFFAVPLRKQLVVIEKLPFPSGTVCAETIKAMHAQGIEALKKARALAVTGMLAGLFTWFRDAKPAVIPSMTLLPGKIGGHALGRLTLGISWSPMLFGVGFLVGPRIGISLLIGAVLGWGTLAPILANAGIIDGIGYRDISHWTRWVAIALMVSSGLTTLILKAKTIIRAFQSMKQSSLSDRQQIEIPFRLWILGFLITAVVIGVVMWTIFDIPLWMTFFAIIVSYIFAVVTIRAYGETDINPVGAVGYSTQLMFGAVAPGRILTNVMAAGITAAGANQSADMMQDLKTGYLLGATPRRQMIAQIIGATLGAVAAVPIFLAVTGAYGLATESLPAPSAVTWSSMAELLSQGLSTLPEYSGIGILGGAFIGIVLSLLENSRVRNRIPSPYGLGIAMIVPGFFSISIFLGSVIRFILDKKFRCWMELFCVPVASGCIAGEGLVGVIIAVFRVTGVL